jgi:hypothetical protein
MMAIITETVRGPLWVILPSGKRLTWERTFTRTDDWRETIFGPVNFGRVTISAERLIVEDANNGQ